MQEIWNGCRRASVFLTNPLPTPQILPIQLSNRLPFQILKMWRSLDLIQQLTHSESACSPSSPIYTQFAFSQIAWPFLNSPTSTTILQLWELWPQRALNCFLINLATQHENSSAVQPTSKKPQRTSLFEAFLGRFSAIRLYVESEFYLIKFPLLFSKFPGYSSITF